MRTRQALIFFVNKGNSTQHPTVYRSVDNTLKWSTVEYSAVQCSAMKYSGVERSTLQCSKVQWSTVPCSLERSRVNCRAASCLPLTASGHWKIAHFHSYFLNVFSLSSNVIYLSKHSVSNKTVTGHPSDIWYLLIHSTCTSTDRSALGKGSLLFPLLTQIN